MAKKGKPEKTGSSTYRNMSENWKTVLLQGIIALVIGIIILAVPDLSVKVVRYLLGGFLVVYGILAFVSAHGLSEEESRVGPYGKAVISFAGGLVVLFWYGLTALSLLYILAVFAIVAGVIVGGMGLLQSWDSIYKAVSGVGGLLSIVFGILLVANAAKWSGSIVWIAGLYSLLLGLLLVCLGFGARAAAKAGRPAS
jgi:uncharacterized membrane protein HdeD (DUF308 family)